MSKVAAILSIAAGVVVGVVFGWTGIGLIISRALIVGGIAALRKPKEPRLASGFGAELQLNGDPIASRKIIYGEAWTAGTLRYRNATGTDNKELYLVIVLAGHEIDSVQAVEADRETLTLDGSGNVTAPAKWVGLMNVRFYLGTDDQTADSTLVTAFANWTSNHRLRGDAYAIVKLTFNEETLSSPPSFRFKTRGRKVYDARLDSTNGGSGSHRLATPSTWEWSRNAITCANDWMRGIMVGGKPIAGLLIKSTRFDWANVIAESNVADEDVALAVGGTQKRYTADGIIDPAQDPGEILRHFEVAIAGDITFADRFWRYFAGAYRAPTLHLEDKHFIGPLRHLVHKGERARFDTVQGVLASTSESGGVIDYPPYSLPSAVAGEEKIFPLDLALVNDAARAQRIAKLMLEREAAGKTISCTTSLYGYRAVPGETILITRESFGISSQAMRVIDCQLRPIPISEGKVAVVTDLVLEAGPESLYAWDAEETAIAASPTLPQAQVPFDLPMGPWTPILANVTRVGSTFTKTGGAASTWDSAFYSQEGYHACAVSWRASDLTTNVMVGLNTDPATDNTEASIDFAIYTHSSGGGGVHIYENGAIVLDAGSRVTTDQFTITYDGLRVRYYRNSTLLRTVALVGARLFVDSSFNNIGAAVNSVTFGPITHVLVNAVGWAADSQGKPAGMRGVQGIDDRSQVSLVDGWMRIASTPDASVVYGIPAIPIDPARTYQITVKWRSGAASTDGLYLLAYEYNAALPSGITHVGNHSSGSVESVVVDAVSSVGPVTNAAMPGTTAVEQTFEYTPTAGAQFMSLCFGNFDPNTSTYLEVAWAALTELGSNVDLLPGVLPPVDTFGLNPESATEVYTIEEFGSELAVFEDKVSVTVNVDSVIVVTGRANSSGGWVPFVGGTDGQGITGSGINFPVVTFAHPVAPGTYDCGVRITTNSANDRFIDITVIKR